MKYYTIGMKFHGKVEWFHKNDLRQLLIDTTSYLEDIELIAEHYFVNDRLIEYILEECIPLNITNDDITEALSKLNMDHLMKRIGEQFPEVYYDENDHVIKGIIDGKYQSIEVGNRLIRKGLPLIEIMKKHNYFDGNVVLKNNKTLVEETLSLVQLLKILQKYQPKILHRFKGLGENNSDDIRRTVMNPNTRSLIRVNIGDIENDMKIFNILRGSSKFDATSRKEMMKEFVPSRYDIDT